ncbi:MAG: PfkB family carbohydrate kinase [Terriglobales bacterium]
MSLVAVGSVAFDSIRTPHGSAERVLGGAATYFALAASQFSPVRVVGVVGDDFRPEHARVFTDRGIDITGIERAPGKSFFWAGEYEKNPNVRHTLTTELNVFASFSPKLPPSYVDSKFLFLGNIDPELQCRVADQMPRTQFVGGDTMNYWIAQRPEQLREFLKHLDLLMINDAEAMQLTDEVNLTRAARAVLAMGPRALVIKRGEHGASLYTPSGAFGAPGYPLEEVCDPTGAGDSFAGGLMGYLACCAAIDDASLRRAVIYGSVLGSFACERFGVERLVGLQRAEVDKRYREFVDLTRFEA